MKEVSADPAAAVRQAYAARFGGEPQFLIRAPGRVNLIGEHTDYNVGFVLPMAIDRAVWLALRPTTDGQVRVHGVDVDEMGEFSLSTLLDSGPPEADTAAQGWLEYLKCTAWALLDAGHRLTGWEGAVAGDVPIGAGLSSSPPAGRAGHALLLDCRTLEGRHVPLPSGTAVVVLDTGTRRGLVDSAYNERRSQCEKVSALFGVPALRDVTSVDLAARAGELDDIARPRASHVISENERTSEAAEALARGDATRMGELMDASCASLRDDFEVSSEALDKMVACARRVDGCYGARMTGAGFGIVPSPLSNRGLQPLWPRLQPKAITRQQLTTRRSMSVPQPTVPE